VAFGSPQPNIVWEINGRRVQQSDSVNRVISVIVDEDEDAIVTNTLEVCDIASQKNIRNVTCTAVNGVTGTGVGVQSASFRLEPHRKALTTARIAY